MLRFVVTGGMRVEIIDGTRRGDFDTWLADGELPSGGAKKT
jgi:hypothetical protein